MYLNSTYTINIFIAHDIADQAKFEEIREHLRGLDERNPAYKIHKIGVDGTGLTTDRLAEIQELVAVADLILLLMSDNSILSTLFASEPIKGTLLQHKNKRSIVVPIILNTCWWEDTIFSNLEVMPRGGLPIYDSTNVKTQLFEQLIEDLDTKLVEIERRKKDLEEQFDQTIREAESIFSVWQKKPEILRSALPLFRQAKSYWREGFSPDIEQIESKISICLREIDFKHYAKAAQEAYEQGDYQKAYFNCKDALNLRNDAIVGKLYEEVSNYLEQEQFNRDKAPFETVLKQAQRYFLDLDWAKAQQYFELALEKHQENFKPSVTAIGHKIRICKREFILEDAVRQSQEYYHSQQYQRMATVLMDSIREVNHESFHQIDYALQLIDYLAHVEAYRDHRTDKWGFKNLETGNVIIAPKYTAAYNFSENLAGAKKWDKWGFIDIEGNEIIPFRYDYVSSFQNGIAQVILKDQTWCINHKGEEVPADIIIKEVPVEPNKLNEEKKPKG
jgi:tetratricopeptide (TPR) repeat protein